MWHGPDKVVSWPKQADHAAELEFRGIEAIKAFGERPSKIL